MISLKLLFSPDTGRILGAQASGKKGVDKRIDVLSVAQRAELTVNDLEHLELTYAPPFNSARDVVNQAGMVATNVKEILSSVMSAMCYNGNRAVIVYLIFVLLQN